MPFPLTHLCVAWNVLESHPLPNPAQFLLGAIAPDAIHFRAEFQGAAMSNIGAAKKITHLCPVSDEKWGRVTDNIGWVTCVKEFIKNHGGDPFIKGYAAHVITDIHNNRTMWNNFRTNHPAEAAKGYTSEYYTDLKKINVRLHHEFPAVSEIMELLERAVPVGIEGLVTAGEVLAIRESLLAEHRDVAGVVGVTEGDGGYSFVSYGDTVEFVGSAVGEVLGVL